MVVVAVVLSGANVVGYTKCSKQASAQLRSYATQAVTSGLTVWTLLPQMPSAVNRHKPGTPDTVQILHCRLTF